MISMRVILRSLVVLATITLGVTWTGSKPKVKTLFLPKAGIVTPITQENTIIAFDIHAVMVEKNKTNMWRHGVKNLLVGRFFFNNKVRAHINSLHEDAAPEDYFMPLLAIVPEIEPYIPGLLGIVNSQDPLPGMKSLIERIAAKKFKLHVLSNIGHAAYYGWQSPTNSTQEKSKGLKEIHADIFKHFKGEVIAAQKPGTQGYIDFEKQFAVQKDGTKKQIIFIDDNLKNVKAAVEQGFVGIWFKDAKQLETDLMRLGIVL